jgi:hypothetical protein
MGAARVRKPEAVMMSFYDQKPAYEGAMLPLPVFAVEYGMSLSTALRHISRGLLTAIRAGGRTYVARSEAERWLRESGDYFRAKNLSLPGEPSVVLRRPYFMTIFLCARGHARMPKPGMARRVEKLRSIGFDIEIRSSRNGLSYLMWDSIEIMTLEQWPLGPNPDALIPPNRQT